MNTEHWALSIRVLSLSRISQRRIYLFIQFVSINDDGCYDVTVVHCCYFYYYCHLFYRFLLAWSFVCVCVCGFAIERAAFWSSIWFQTFLVMSLRAKAYILQTNRMWCIIIMYTVHKRKKTAIVFLCLYSSFELKRMSCTLANHLIPSFCSFSFYHSFGFKFYTIFYGTEYSMCYNLRLNIDFRSFSMWIETSVSNCL